MKLTAVDPTRQGGVLRAIAITVVVSFVTAWVLAAAVFVAWSFAGGAFIVVAVMTGALLWAGFTAARFITHDAFEGRPVILTVLNIAHEFATIVVMALIIGSWPPAGL